MVVWHILGVQLGWGKAVAEHDVTALWGYGLKAWMIALAIGLQSFICLLAENQVRLLKQIFGGLTIQRETQDVRV